MYLKSLELHGFKSFPDKVKLTFDRGLTGVVGPNGSGKSNIGDAVRWVLGEQSTKTLRGNKMEDVIFSGTTARKAVGFASVTLVIDNSLGELNNDQEEVAITRKIYRSGESEYKINGKNVRLKDINELFMDTGLGRDGYSIIGQGRIAEIVDAKSSERRDIFEEAAGISKFRYKKAEAQRKLEQSQENINRLSDIVSELETRKDPLFHQAQKAEKFLVLAEKRKQLELSLWINDLDELKDVINKLSEDALLYTAQYESIENAIESKENEIQSAYKKMRDITVRTDEYKTLILETEKESSDYRSQIAVCENNILHSNNLIESVKEKQKLRESSRKQLDEKTELSKKSLEEAKKLSIDITDELHKTEKKFKDIEIKAQSIEESFGQQEAKLNALYLKQNEAKLHQASLKASLLQSQEQLSEINSQFDTLSQTSEKYSKDIEELKESVKLADEKETELKNKFTGLSMMYKNKRSVFDEKKNHGEKLLFSIKEKQQREKLLTDLENSMEGFNYSVKEIIKASKSSRIPGIYGTVAQLISVEQEYTVAVETALGGALQNVIVKNEDTAKRCISLLKELKKGRATFLPVTSVKPYDFYENDVRNEPGFMALGNEIVNCDSEFSGIMSNLLGRTVIAEDIDYATIIAKKYKYKFRIVTLDGQIINAGGSFTGGSAVQSHGVLTRKNEINTLKEEISELSQSFEQMQGQIEKLKAETENLSAQIEAVNDEKSLVSQDKMRFSSELRSIESLLEQTENQKKAYHENKKRLEEKIKNTQELFDKALLLLDNTGQEIEKEKSGMDSQQSLRETLASQRSELSEKLYELKIKRMENDKNIENIRLEINHIINSGKELSEDELELENQLKEQNDIIKECMAEIQKNNLMLENKAKDIENYREEIKKSSHEHDEYEKNVTEMRNALRSINEDKENVSRQLSRVDEKKINKQRDYDSIISRMWENYELTRSEAEKCAVKLEDKVQAQKQLNEVKTSIKSLGNINVAAIEEYKEVSERYEFLSGQLFDVEKSKRELEKLINDLTNDMQRIFAECFVKINENFKSIFTELFGGGKAELELTDPDNVLESGIEIKVAPPGKVIKNLISLSGGEQAFVAIAIYFAILKIKPAPFCILDEIDAALDEVNVRKYAMYLKNFVDTTQFILVTHRRGTMELANVLYGVTMQQNGVSKLLKMNQVDIPDEM